MPEQEPKKKNQPNNKKPKRSPLSWLYYIVMIGLMIFFFFPMGGEKGADKNLSYTKFTAYIDDDAVASIVVYDDNTAEAKAVIRIIDNLQVCGHILDFFAVVESVTADNAVRHTCTSQRLLDGV